MADRTALGEAEEVRPVEPGGVHDGDEVLDPLVDGRHAVGAVGRARAPLVEVEHLGEPAQAGEERLVLGPLPRQLDVLGERRHDDDLGRPVAPRLVGDGGAVDACEPDR